MKHLTGWLSAAAAPENEAERQRLVEEINRIIKPAQAATPENIYLGLLHAASNEVNVQGGCFDEAELSNLAQLIVDVPVLIGHKKQELPIGRVFKAEIVERGSVPWLRAYFYWHRQQAGAEQLKAGIDAGIYRECSLGFLYGKPECAVCGQDMRNCRHRVNESVRVGGREIKAFYFYRQIEKVLEVSLVYRGAVAGTSVSTLGLAAESSRRLEPFWRQRAQVRFDLEHTGQLSGELLVEPLYRGVWLALTTGDKSAAALMPSGQVFRHPVLEAVAQRLHEQPAVLVCQLVAMRGSSRLPIRSLLRDSDRVRARLIAFDLAELAGQSLAHLSLSQRREMLAELIREIPEIELAALQTCTLAELATQPGKFGTSNGMRILAATDGNEVIEYRRKPGVKVQLRLTGAGDATALAGEVRDGGRLQLESALDLEALKVEDGAIVWAEPCAGSVSRYRVVDLALGEVQADALGVGEVTPPKHEGTFVLLLDNHGNGWLHLKTGGTERLFKIAMLRLPLLQQGRRFWSALITATPMTRALPSDVRIIDRGDCAELQSDEKAGVAVTLTGSILRQRYHFVKTKLSGHRAYLFSQARSAAEPEEE